MKDRLKLTLILTALFALVCAPLGTVYLQRYVQKQQTIDAVKVMRQITEMPPRFTTETVNVGWLITDNKTGWQYLYRNGSFVRLETTNIK